MQVENRSDEYSQIAVQGPVAEKLVQEFTDIDLTPMAYYHFAHGPGAGASDAIVSRTGYTGEDGFEIYFKSDAAAASKLFLDLAEKGEKYDALPAGLGARDTLRLEAKMALYGNDIDDSHTVLEADLGWILKLKKESPSSARTPWPGRKRRGSAASWSVSNWSTRASPATAIPSPSRARNSGPSPPEPSPHS